MADFPRDKRQKFKSLAEKRVNRTIHDLRLIGNLANRSNYEYTHRDMESILGALDGEMRRLRERLLARSSRDTKLFKL